MGCPWEIGLFARSAHASTAHQGKVLAAGHKNAAGQTFVTEPTLVTVATRRYPCGRKPPPSHPPPPKPAYALAVEAATALAAK